MDEQSVKTSRVPLRAKPSPDDTLVKCIENSPLHTPSSVRFLFEPGVHADRIAFPRVINVHCQGEECGGVRRHTIVSKQSLFVAGRVYGFAAFECVNCEAALKIYGVMAVPEKDGHLCGTCTKIYEEPAFGDPIPKRLFRIIGEKNRAHFLQARRAIARGLGIGAYAYYRRIIENDKFDLIHSVLLVARSSNTTPVQIHQLEQAEKERQFSKAIETIRDNSAIPAVLLIDGHNPLSLLHDLLSEGIHGLNDDECLQRAREAEVILFEIAERMQIALADRQRVKAAIANVMRRKKSG